MTPMIGFGVDGQNETCKLDFAEVRDEFENNETVKAIKTHMENKKALENKIINWMQSIHSNEDPTS